MCTSFSQGNLGWKGRHGRENVPVVLPTCAIVYVIGHYDAVCNASVSSQTIDDASESLTGIAHHLHHHMQQASHHVHAATAGRRSHAK